MKTASSSIEVALSDICGPDDIITHMGDRESYRMRFSDRGGTKLLHPS